MAGHVAIKLFSVLVQMKPLMKVVSSCNTLCIILYFMLYTCAYTLYACTYDNVYYSLLPLLFEGVVLSKVRMRPGRVDTET